MIYWNHKTNKNGGKAAQNLWRGRREETEAAAEPHKIGQEGEGMWKETLSLFKLKLKEELTKIFISMQSASLSKSLKNGYLKKIIVLGILHSYFRWYQRLAKKELNRQKGSKNEIWMQYVVCSIENKDESSK